MTGPDNSHICDEVHPDQAHFIWITTQKKAERLEAAQSGTISDALGVGADQVVLDLLDSEEFAEQHAVGMIDIDEDDLRGNSPWSGYRSSVDAACADIRFDEVFVALQNSGKIWSTERPISSWRGDSNKFMCPSSTHDNPGASTYSAWGSKEKGVWTCTKGCGDGQGGGDKFTLAKFLYDDQDFHRVAERMALDFRGVRKPEAGDILKPPVGQDANVAEDNAGSDANGSSGQRQQAAELGAVVPESADTSGAIASAPVVTKVTEKITVILPGGQRLDKDDDPEQFDWMASEESRGEIPTYRWQDVLGLTPVTDTFLHRYCSETAKDTTPEEFNLFNGLIALGLLVGNRVSSQDFLPLSPNFGVVLVADSGGGKTRAVGHLKKVMREVEPQGPGTGVKFISSPASGPILVKSFIHEEADPVTGAPVRFPIKALVTFDEFSEMASNTKMIGSNIKEKIHALLDHQTHLEYMSASMGILTAENPFGSILTGTQPDRLKDLLTKADAASGFINRFFFVMGTPKKQLARGAVDLDFSASVAALKDLRSKYSRAMVIGWSFEADVYLETVFEERVFKLKARDKKDILTRLDLNFKRMVLAFAINERADEIQVHHVKMAESLLGYLVRCYGGVITRIVTSVANDIGDWCHRRIAALELQNYLKKQSEWEAAGSQGEFNPGNYGVTVAALKREYRKKDWEDQDVNRALNFLKNNDLITAMPGAGLRGPKTTYYYSNEAPYIPKV